MIIAQISVTGYGVAHIMVLSAVGQIKKLPTSILWHISKGNWTVKPDTTWLHFTIWAESIWQQVLLILPQNTVMFSSNSCTLYLFKCIAQYLVQVEEIWIVSDKDFAITGLTQCQNTKSYNAHTMSICNKLFSFSIHVVGGESCLGRNQNMKQLTCILHCTMLCKIHVMRNWLEKTLHYSIL